MRMLPALLLLAAACEQSAGPSAAPASAPAPAGPSKPEPAKITVRHILISFKGTRTQATRTQEEAKALAAQIFEIAKKGEDFAALMRTHSDDSGGGTYTLVNDGQTGSPPQVYGRRQMVPAFGNVGFKLELNEIGMASFDAANSPFGWHIIQRIQ